VAGSRRRRLHNVSRCELTVGDTVWVVGFVRFEVSGLLLFVDSRIFLWAMVK
jgi:hypothetical protein